VLGGFRGLWAGGWGLGREVDGRTESRSESTRETTGIGQFETIGPCWQHRPKSGRRRDEVDAEAIRCTVSWPRTNGEAFMTKWYDSEVSQQTYATSTQPLRRPPDT